MEPKTLWWCQNKNRKVNTQFTNSKNNDCWKENSETIERAYSSIEGSLNVVRLTREIESLRFILSVLFRQNQAILIPLIDLRCKEQKIDIRGYFREANDRQLQENISKKEDLKEAIKDLRSSTIDKKGSPFYSSVSRIKGKVTKKLLQLKVSKQSTVTLTDSGWDEKLVNLANTVLDFKRLEDPLKQRISDRRPLELLLGDNALISTERQNRPSLVNETINLELDDHTKMNKDRPPGI